MNKEEFNNFIKFADQKDYIEKKLGKEEWITVYQSKEQEENGYKSRGCFYSCFVSEEKKKKDNREDSSWIMPMVFGGGPEVVEYDEPLSFIDRVKQSISHKFFHEFKTNLWGIPLYKMKKLNREKEGNKNKFYLGAKYKVKKVLFKKTKNLLEYEPKKTKKYYRFDEEGIEPLVHIRHFDNSYPSYIEISEEFRHYFNLYEDRDKNIFLSFDESGIPIEVIKIVDDNGKREVQIKKKYINEFLFVKEMWLCVQFDHLRRFKEAFVEPVNKSFQSEDGNYIYSLNSRNEDKQFSTRFRGRKFIGSKAVKFLWYEQA